MHHRMTRSWQQWKRLFQRSVPSRLRMTLKPVRKTNLWSLVRPLYVQSHLLSCQMVRFYKVWIPSRYSSLTKTSKLEPPNKLSKIFASLSFKGTALQRFLKIKSYFQSCKDRYLHPCSVPSIELPDDKIDKVCLNSLERL